MEEMRRFLRYVIPGLVFAVEALVLLWVAVPELMKSIIGHLEEDKGIGLVIASFLASGGAGYIFASIHHYLYWHCKRYPSFCYRTINIYEYDEYGAKDFEKKAFKQRDQFRAIRRCQWVYVTAMWYERLDRSSVLRGADKRALTLADLVHSSGSSFIASCCSIGAAGFILGHETEATWDAKAVLHGIAGFLIGFFLIIMHFKNYKNSVDLNQRFVERAFNDAEKEKVLSFE